MVKINNYMEDIVNGLADTIISGLDVCQCEICKADIIAMTLNTVPPKYVATRNGSLYTKLNSLQQQFEVDVMSAMTRSAEKVKQNPRHEI